jgi:hypothetical protein
MSKKGKNVTIKGVLYEDGSFDHRKDDDIYKSKGGKEAVESTVTETATTEVVSQATQSGIQAVVTQVQTQVANLGASGLIAVGSAGAFQVEHMHDHTSQAVEKATPMITELVETGTIQDTIPEGHSKHGQEIPVVKTFFGVKVGEERNKTDEQRKAEETMVRSARSPQVNDFGEQEASME